MLNTISKFLGVGTKYVKHNSLLRPAKSYFANAIIYHHLDIDSQSDKWSVQFSFKSNTLLKNQDKVKPYVFGNVFLIKLVEKSMKFVKALGRPQYKIQFNANEIIKLSFWSPEHGKYQNVKSNQFKEQVLTIQKIANSKSDSAASLLPQKSDEQNQGGMFRFSFYNNKIQEQKSKQFYLCEADFKLLQQSLKSANGALTFNQMKEQYEIWKLQRQITRKQMIINSGYGKGQEQN